MNRQVERLYNGLVKENPTFVMLLGLCPTLAVTTSAVNALGMGLCTTAVLILSNAIISALRKIISREVRVPAFIVIVATLVTMVEFLMDAYLPSLAESLGVYIPLIVVNCIILGRAEAYASRHPVLPSIFDGIGMGLGFTVGLLAIGIFRELIGKGTIFGLAVFDSFYVPVSIIALPPGAFFVVGILIAVINAVRRYRGMKDSPYLDQDPCQTCTNRECMNRLRGR